MHALIKTFLYEKFIALRYLRSKRREGFVSVIAGFSFLGIMLGVATLIIVTSVMNGFQEELFSRMIGINSPVLVYPASGHLISNYQQKIKIIKENKDVSTVIPLIEGQVMITNGQASNGALVRGISPSDFQKKKVLFEKYMGGEMSSFKGDEIIVGYRLAQKMRVSEGDNLTLISPQGNRTAFGMIPRFKSYRVLGTFDSGMYEYDSNFVFMPFKQAQSFFMYQEKEASQLEVGLFDLSKLDETLYRLSSALSKEVRVYDFKRSNAAFFNAVEVEKNVMFLILTLIIIVAAFNMISGLVMMVKDKNKDIAILRTMGASKGSVMRIFLMDGFMVGFWGTFFGTTLGLLFCHYIEHIRRFIGYLAGRDLFSAEIYFLSKLPAKVDSLEVILIVSMALGLSFLATLYPSWRASKIDPVEALRYE
ncbi:MAG: lipoprotein-releasing ABC transporter permease subunit [Alphaproteobacteria bacterium]|nr:lipoprotein-releasing ABC transporter permease subunit [Alphaproteobacteria bacterium]NCB49777.1 lipoprotein-releasing ABC transporter permease subunit [Alphaproteobacteria bacterium]